MDAPTPTRPDPLLPGFREVLYWRITEGWRRVVGLQLAVLATLPVAFFALTKVAARLPTAVGTSDGLSGGEQALAIVAATIAAIAAHEGVHGLFIRIFGARPRFGIDWTIGAAYATAPGHPFRRDQFIAVALAPLVLITIAGIALLPVTPSALRLAMLVGLSLNAAGAAGDLWMTWILFRFPRSARVVDERDGFRVLVPDELGLRAHE